MFLILILDLQKIKISYIYYIYEYMDRYCPYWANATHSFTKFYDAKWLRLLPDGITSQQETERMVDMMKVLDTITSIMVGALIGGIAALIAVSSNMFGTQLVLNTLDPFVRIGLILALIYGFRMVFPKRKRNARNGRKSNTYR